MTEAHCTSGSQGWSLATRVAVAGVLLLAGCGGSGETKTVMRTLPLAAPPPTKANAVPPSKATEETGTSYCRGRSCYLPGYRPTAFVALHPATGCGTERWAVKTLTDAAASQVNLTPKATTIATLTALAAPQAPTDRVAPTETTTWRLTGVRLVGFKREADRDIHLVIEDRAGRRMIVEMPKTPDCDQTAPAPLRQKMAAARQAFEARFGQPPSAFRTLSGTATITGVGFFDRIHGQTGVAPNGIELHPLLSFATP
jgi:hypothetical protein